MRISSSFTFELHRLNKATGRSFDFRRIFLHEPSYIYGAFAQDVDPIGTDVMAIVQNTVA
jgi:hypothetical protein